MGMNPDTGEIREFKTKEDIPEKWIPIPEDKVEEIRTMNRQQRRAWAREEAKRISRGR